LEEKPSLGRALATFGSAVAVLLVSLRLGAGMHLPVVLGTVTACVAASLSGLKWNRIQAALFRGVQDGLPAISILLLVGMIVGLWLVGGTIPTLIWYGLSWLSPGVLVPAACLLAAVASTATGTSFGTISTLGIALMGVSEASGIPSPLMAGAIVSGAYFGDKMSPLSDTTNVAPAVSGTTVYEHIHSMMFTTVPSLAISVVGFYFLGLSAGGRADAASIESLKHSLEANFNIGPMTLLPALAILAMSIKKLPALPSLAAGVLVSALSALATQGARVQSLARAATNGFTGQTGHQVLDTLLTRGGMMSMLPTVLLILAATALGGVLKETGTVRRLVEELLLKVKSRGGLVLATISSCSLTLVASGNQMLAIILPGQSFKDAFAMRDLHPKVLSRTLEDAGTLGAALIPWSTAALFIQEMLKVPSTSYWKYALLNWITPLIAVIYALTGTCLFRLGEGPKGTMENLQGGIHSDN
jgi:NhaC family Na+:H+ antiporter